MPYIGKIANYVRNGACAKWATVSFEGSTPFMGGYIVWNGAPLTEAEVEAKRAEWEASVAADKALSNVITRRKAEYGPVEDQLDMQYWDSVHGTRIWLDHIAAVKAKHPKPE